MLRACCAPHRENSGGMLAAFFGERGDQQLDLSQFSAFMAALHAELVRLEFAHYNASEQASGACTTSQSMRGQAAPACARTRQVCRLCMCGICRSRMRM